MDNSDQSFKVHRDNIENPESTSQSSNTPTDLQQTNKPHSAASTPLLVSTLPPPAKELVSFRKPLRILNHARNMSAHIPLEEMFAKAAFFAQQTSWVPGSEYNGIFQFTKLPVEIQEKIVEEFVRLCSPNLSVVKDYARVPVTQDLGQQARPSCLLNQTVALELEASLYASLLVSKAWYVMVAGHMTRDAVFIDGPFNLQRLLLFGKRRDGLDLYNSAEEPVVDRPARVFTFGIKYYSPSGGGEDSNGWTSDEIKGTPYYFDIYGEGPWWHRPEGYHSDALMTDVYKHIEGDKWCSIPGWVRGGSPNTGGHLNYGDGSIDDDSIDGSIINYGSVLDDGSIKDGGSVKGGDGNCETDDTAMGNGLNEDLEPGSFLADVKTLILGPGVSEIHKSDIPHWVSSVARQDDPEKDPIVSVYYRIPATHILHRVFGKSGKPARLQNLVISGHLWSNTWLFVPRPVESDLRFPNLTSLTLSLTYPSHKQASPMRTLHYFRDHCADRHLCMLLTGRRRLYDGSVIEEGSTFLKTLEYLHIRGPGAHCCSQLFKANWRKLGSVIIELPTTAAICETNARNLITAIEKRFLRRCPNAEVRVGLRTVMSWLDTEFDHYFWRRMKDAVPATPSYPGEALPLAHSPNGINVVLFEKCGGKKTIVRAHADWIYAIDRIQHEEQAYGNAAINYFIMRDGIDVRTMVWERDHIWIAAENAAYNLAVAEEEAIAAAENAAAAAGWNTENSSSPEANDSSSSSSSEEEEEGEGEGEGGGETDYEALKRALDDEFTRQNNEYAQHILDTLKKGFTRETFTPEE